MPGDDAKLSRDEARYAASLVRAEQRAKEREATRFPAGDSSRAAFEKSAEVYRVIAEKLELQAGEG